MEYGIDLQIDDKGLQAIYGAGQRVTLVKNGGPNSLDWENLPVAWIVFDPLEGNAIRWIENYYLFAASGLFQPGLTIEMMAQTAGPAQRGGYYTFQNGEFSAAPGTGNDVTVINNTPSPNFIFGLAQQVSVNGSQITAPVSAQPVLYNCEATFTPLETMAMWIFLSPTASNGVVLGKVPPNFLAVPLSSQGPIAKVGFNDSNNTFFRTS